MTIIDIDKYRELIRNERTKRFDGPYDLTYIQFEKQGYHKKDVDFFFNNASEIIENLRNSNWNEFVPLEKRFTSEMLSKLVDKHKIANKTGLDVITWFVETFPEYIYALTLSNTQSRRSRAGKEFEAIIELILIGAKIPMDSQGNIGKKAFTSKGLGKLVDIVSPGAIEYTANKRNTVLISAKTTLRERWQEVPEEMGRTGAREMFLATLDDGITSEVIETLNDSNIQVVTLKSIKENHYAKYSNVISFEDLLTILKSNTLAWDGYQYDETSKNNIVKSLKKQKLKHTNHPFVSKYYEDQLNRIK